MPTKTTVEWIVDVVFEDGRIEEHMVPNTGNVTPADAVSILAKEDWHEICLEAVARIECIGERITTVHHIVHHIPLAEQREERS